MESVKAWTVDCLKETKSEGRRKAVLKERVRSVKDWAVDCFRQPAKAEHREEEGRKSTMLRVIELSSASTPLKRSTDGRLSFHIGSVKVEEHDVREVDSDGP